jgi:hypothetical protein
MINPINRSGTPASWGSDVPPRIQVSDSVLSKAWSDHVERRIVMLKLELISCISESAFQRRISALKSPPANGDPTWELTRKLLTMAQQEAAAMEDLDWRDNFSRASILLTSASMPDRMPRHGDRSLIEFPDDGAPFLADDALVLAHLEKPFPYDYWQQHAFWIQWKDERGNDAGYRLTIEGNDDEDNPGLDPPRLTVSIEQLGIADSWVAC